MYMVQQELQWKLEVGPGIGPISEALNSRSLLPPQSPEP